MLLDKRPARLRDANPHILTGMQITGIRYS